MFYICYISCYRWLRISFIYAFVRSRPALIWCPFPHTSRSTRCPERPVLPFCYVGRSGRCYRVDYPFVGYGTLFLFVCLTLLILLWTLLPMALPHLHIPDIWYDRCYVYVTVTVTLFIPHVYTVARDCVLPFPFTDLRLRIFYLPTFHVVVVAAHIPTFHAVPLLRTVLALNTLLPRCRSVRLIAYSSVRSILLDVLLHLHHFPT